MNEFKKKKEATDELIDMDKWKEAEREGWMDGWMDEEINKRIQTCVLDTRWMQNEGTIVL